MLVRLFFCLFLLWPGLASSDNRIAALEETALHRNNLQPDLQQYACNVSLEDLAALAHVAQLPSEATLPELAPLTRYWQRNRQGMVTTGDTQLTAAEQPLVEILARILESGLGRPLIPAGHAEQRQTITAQATVKTAETQLGQILLKRIEFTFDTPTSLQEAFYSKDLPLPQEQVTNLHFDIDSGNHTLQ